MFELKSGKASAVLLLFEPFKYVTYKHKDKPDSNRMQLLTISNIETFKGFYLETWDVFKLKQVFVSKFGR
jgi:hypothetical protein